MHIMLICGNVRERSRVRTLMRYLENLLIQKGVQTTFWCLREQPLPIAPPEYHKDPLACPDESVRTFVTTVNASNGFVLGSPLYHGSYSGVLKNALDNLHYDAFRDKPTALVSNGGGMRSSIQACEHLRSVVRTLYGYPTQAQIGTCPTDYHETDDGYELIDKDIQRRCALLMQELLLLAHLFGHKEQLQKGHEANLQSVSAAGSSNSGVGM